MEGIMMRHKDKYAIAVRKPDGEIVCKVEDYKSVLGGAGVLEKADFSRHFQFCGCFGCGNEVSDVFS